jgi:hypothetical protein
MADSSISSDRTNQISGGVFVIGLGVLFLTKFWFPGIFFVIAATLAVQCLQEGRTWYASQGVLWMLGLGLLFALARNGAVFVGLLLVLVGISAILTAYQKPPFLKKPYVDTSME